MNCLRLLALARLWQGMSSLTIFQCVRTGHHMDRIDEELVVMRASFLFLPKPNRPSPGINHDRRIRIS